MHPTFPNPKIIKVYNWRFFLQTNESIENQLQKSTKHFFSLSELRTEHQLQIVTLKWQHPPVYDRVPSRLAAKS